MSHITSWKCALCDKIHVATFDEAGKVDGQISIPLDHLNAVIIELMRLRDEDTKQ